MSTLPTAANIAKSPSATEDRNRSGAASTDSAAKTKGTGRSLLVSFLNKLVHVVTNDGRVVTGYLLGFDQVSNLVMNRCVERIFSVEQGVEFVERGVHVLRGDNVATVGEVEEAKDKAINWSEVTVCFAQKPESTYRSISPHVSVLTVLAFFSFCAFNISYDPEVCSLRPSSTLTSI